jgi:hypothetical protein
MKLSSKLLSAAAGIFVAAGSWSAAGATKPGAIVSLSLSDGDSTPTARTVVPGSTFTITVNLTTTTALTGVDYYLQTTGASSGKFRILDRTVGSALSDTIKADAGNNGSAPGVEDTNFSLLNPRNGLDLGASVTNVSTPVAAGIYSLATYTISVPSDVPAGTYTLSTTSDAGTGWVETAPLFDEWSFNAQGSFAVTVQGAGVGTGVPEPATAGLAACGLIGLLARRAGRR